MIRKNRLVQTGALAVAFSLIAMACKNDADNGGVPAVTEGNATNEVVADSPTGTIHPDDLVEIGGDPVVEGEFDPCSLVTPAEVEGILGQTVNDIYRHNTALCEYFADEPSFGSATIRIETNVSEQDLMSALDTLEQVGQSDAQEISGLGDSAYSVGPLVYVAKGTTTLLVVVAKEESPSVDRAKALASKALVRLPSDL